MKEIKKSINMIMYNFNTLVKFELFYKLITLLIFSPLFVRCFDLIMKVTGYTYLTYENIVSFILSPITLCMLLILILLLLIYTLFDITAIIIILDKSYHKEKITVKEAIFISILKIKNIFKIKNISLAFFVLVMIPFLNFGLASGFISSLSIPEFINDYIASNSILSTIFTIIVFVLYIFLIRWIYSLHYFIIEGKNFKEARISSVNLIKHNQIKDIILFIMMSAICTILYLLLLLVGIFIIYSIGKIFKKAIIIESFTATIIWIFLAISYIIFTLLSVPISYSIISTRFYKHKIDKNEKIIELEYNKKEEKRTLIKRGKYLKITLCVIALLCGTAFTYNIYKGNYNINIEYARTTEITAHRGASVDYPENTMEAFVGAKKLGADWIELDVQQTKDGNIIVMHDTNLSRTAGVDLNTWEVSYDEIKDLDVGSFLDNKFSNSRIPLLKDVIKWAKENNMKLNIELKPTGNEKNFEKNVIDIINEYNFKDYCVITSQVYTVLENVKKLDNNIETVYVMSLAYGNIIELDKADSFSIEATSINKNLVSKIHNEGKKVYAWTINTEENIEKMIDLNVDNIITDNIIVAKNTVYESKSSNLVNEFMKVINSLFS